MVPRSSRTCGTITDGMFFSQAEDGIRGGHVTGVKTCALPISDRRPGIAETAQPRVVAATAAHRPWRAGGVQVEDEAGVVAEAADLAQIHLQLRAQIPPLQQLERAGEPLQCG